MSISREEMEAQERRRRQARAEADREAGRLRQELDAARIEHEQAAARLALGTDDEAAVVEIEEMIDGFERALRRACATAAGLAA